MLSQRTNVDVLFGSQQTIRPTWFGSNQMLEDEKLKVKFVINKPNLIAK